MMQEKEKCQIDKFIKRYKKCDSTDIFLYVTEKKIPLCYKHWSQVCSGVKEW